MKSKKKPKAPPTRTEKGPGPPNEERLVRLLKVVSIRAVRLVASSSSVSQFSTEALSTITFNVRVGAMKRAPEFPDLIQTLQNFAITFHKGDPAGPNVKISCNFLLDYRVADPKVYDEVTNDDLLAFAGRTGTFNAWPYAREFCQSIGSRAGMMLVLPTFLQTGKAHQEEAVRLEAKHIHELL